MKLLKLIISAWNDCSEYNKAQKKIKKLYPKIKRYKIRVTKDQMEMLHYFAFIGVKDAISLDKLLTELEIIKAQNLKEFKNQNDEKVRDN